MLTATACLYLSPLLAFISSFIVKSNIQNFQTLQLMGINIFLYINHLGNVICGMYVTREDTYEVFDDDHIPEVGKVGFHH